MGTTASMLFNVKPTLLKVIVVLLAEKNYSVRMLVAHTDNHFLIRNATLENHFMHVGDEWLDVWHMKLHNELWVQTLCPL